MAEQQTIQSQIRKTRADIAKAKQTLNQQSRSRSQTPNLIEREKTKGRVEESRSTLQQLYQQLHGLGRQLRDGHVQQLRDSQQKRKSPPTPEKIESAPIAPVSGGPQ